MYRNYDEGKKVVSVVYENLSEMEDITQSDINRYQVAEIRKGWTGVRTKEELVDIVHNGWEEGVRKIEENLSIVQLPRLANTRRRKTRGDFGDHLDIQAVYSGNLERAWEKAERQTSPSVNGNRIVIACDIGANSGMSPERMFWRGAVASALADMLIASGRSVKVVGYFCSSSTFKTGADLVEHTVVIKDYEESLMIDKIAAVLSFAGFFRYYGFLSYYSQPWEVHTHLGNHRAQVPKALREESGAELLVVDNIWGKDAAQNFLNAFANRQNGVVA